MPLVALAATLCWSVPPARRPFFLLFYRRNSYDFQTKQKPLMKYTASCMSYKQDYFTAFGQRLFLWAPALSSIALPFLIASNGDGKLCHNWYYSTGIIREVDFPLKTASFAFQTLRKEERPPLRRFAFFSLILELHKRRP